MLDWCGGVVRDGSILLLRDASESCGFVTTVLYRIHCISCGNISLIAVPCYSEHTTLSGASDSKEFCVLTPHA
jgi:hypothetical protein